MKVKRKKGIPGDGTWVFCCERDKKDPWGVHEAELRVNNTGPVYAISGIAGGWTHINFEVISDSSEVFATKPENKPVYKIFKYTLPIAERTHIDLPVGAQILRVDGLEGGLWVWAMVDTTASLERREFALFKTGGDMPDKVAEEYKYVGCGSIYIQQELCLYVFEKLRR